MMFTVKWGVYSPFWSEGLSYSLILRIVTLLRFDRSSLGIVEMTAEWRQSSLLGIFQGWCQVNLLLAWLSSLWHRLSWIVCRRQELGLVMQIGDEFIHVEFFGRSIVHHFTSASNDRFEGCRLCAVHIQGFAQLLDSCSCNRHYNLLIFDHFVYFLFELVHLKLRLFEWSLSSIKLC